MADVPNSIRIPNLPTGAIVDSKGMPTSDELFFRQALLTLLQNALGPEGLVIPSQTSTDITIIQNNTNDTQGSPTTVYTCQPGTFLYNSTNNTVQVAILVAGVPTFKTVTVT
jgi:hypothetical protein